MICFIIAATGVMVFVLLLGLAALGGNGSSWSADLKTIERYGKFYYRAGHSHEIVMAALENLSSKDGVVRASNDQIFQEIDSLLTAPTGKDGADD